MKKTLYVSLFLGLVLACDSEDKLVFEVHQMEWELCKRCPKVEVTIPKATNNTATAHAINIALEEEVIRLLPFKDEETVQEIDTTNIDTLAQEEDEEPMQEQEIDTTSTDTLAREIADEKKGWEAEIKGEIVYSDSNILTVMLNIYTYTGGAHGYSTITYLNFSRKEGKKLENPELFENLEAFQQFAENQFRQQQDITPMENINATRFKFKDGIFHLPHNIGYTQEGLQLTYNPHEVASYEEGPIVLVFPYSVVNLYLKWEVLEK